MKMIEKLYANDKYSEKLQAVTEDTCNRCLGNNIYKDRYGRLHCLDCYEYGEVHDGMSIYRYERPTRRVDHELHIDYKLTAKQEKGADFLVDCYNDKKNGFLQAVCGAGKTEMTYKVILEVLNNNQKVCFVIPRVAVIKEVSKRLEKHFPNTIIKTLMEGNKDYSEANLIVSTPQQLIYFYSEFDLMIVDEVDAFPLKNNRFLKRLIDKSLKPYGVMLMMSATKDESIMRHHDMRFHLIPSRFHRKPLAIPEYLRFASTKKMLSILINFSEGTRQTLIFVPTIKTGEMYKDKLAEKGIKTEMISSVTKYKNQIIKSFREKDIRILLSTTILERGVTFHDIDCVVIQADHPVFTKDAIIQISGRVGRIPQYDEGSVLLYSKTISKEMSQARKEIIWMNKQNEMPDL